MNNRFIKLQFLLLIFLLLFINVNAEDGAVGECDGITISEQKAVNTGFDAPMEICDWKFDNKYESAGKANTITGATREAFESINVTVPDIDLKGYTSTTVTRCKDENTKINVATSCTYLSYKGKPTIPVYKQLPCKSGATSYNNKNNNRDIIASDFYKKEEKIYKKIRATYIDVEDDKPKDDKPKDTTPECVITGYKCAENLEERDGLCYEEKSERNKYNKPYKSLWIIDVVNEFINCRTKVLTSNGKEIKFSVTYEIMCPKYSCNPVTKIMNICTPSYSYNNNIAFCLNPNHPFGEKYKVDNSFDPSKCENSYSTKDCGLANILIEGKNHNLSYKAIETALRLWSIHVGNIGGYDGPGVSNRTGVNCDEDAKLKLGSDGKTSYNLYKSTYQSIITQGYFKSLSSSDKDYTDIYNSLSSYAFECNGSLLGRACRGNYRESEALNYREATALLLSTIFGNKNMKLQYKEISGAKETTTIEDVKVVDGDEDKKFKIEVYFEDLGVIDIEKNVKIDCNNLDKMVSDGVITLANKAQIAAFCKTEVHIGVKKGDKIEILSDLGGGMLDYCTKEYCVKVIKSFAICDKTTTSTRKIVLVTHTVPSAKKSVIKKLISCGQPKINQEMISLDVDKKPGETTTERITEEFPITNYKCDGECEEYDVKIDGKSKCENNISEYDKSFKMTIKDPSLSCIINMNDSSQSELYDYSHEFGVNTNFCKVYCSDEVEFNIADKVKSTSGRLFTYDIERQVNGTKRHTYKFSNIVKVKRKCLSKIFYDKVFEDNKNWKEIYGLSNEVSSSITNWKELYTALVNKAKEENNRYENINKIIYDLYNCNLYSEEDILGVNEIYRPKNYKKNNTIIENVRKLFSSDNNYGLTNCKINGTKEEKKNCYSMEDIDYDFGGLPDGQIVNMNYSFNNTNTLNNIKYCSGANCFNYTKTNSDKQYNYNATENSKTETKTDFGKNVNIPTNDFAYFEITTDISFYNNSKLLVKSTGEVIKEKKSDDTDNYMDIDSYNYTVNKDAYNICNNNLPDGNSNLHRCNIEQKFNNISLYFRKTMIDNFSNTIANNKNFSCYVDVLPPIPETPSPKDVGGEKYTLYRNVDIFKLFPNSSTGFSSLPNSNWTTEIGKKATKQIEQSAETYRLGDEYLEYKITLTPDEIKNIREYNSRDYKKGLGYFKDITHNCDIDNSLNIYRNCKSSYLDLLRSGNGLKISYGTLDPDYSDGVSKFNNKDEKKK